MTQHQNKTAAAATVDDEGHDMAFEGLLASLSDLFARSETRETFARMTQGMLMELEDVNALPRVELPATDLHQRGQFGGV